MVCKTKLSNLYEATGIHIIWECCDLSPVSVLWRINQESLSKSLLSLPSLMNSQPRVNCGFQTCWVPEERGSHEEKIATRNHNSTLSPFLLADTGSSTHFRLSDFHIGFRIPWEDSVRFYLKKLDDNAHSRLLPRVHMDGPQHQRAKRQCFTLSFPTQDSCSGAEKENPASGLLKMEMGTWGVRKVRRMRAKVKTKGR